MARTAPAPNIPPIPGMCPSIAVLAGGGDGGGDSGGSAGDGSGDDNAGTSNGGESADADKRSAPAGQPGQDALSHPVDVVTGRAYTDPVTDVRLPGPLPLRWTRVYSSAAAERDVGLGFGWAHSLGWEIEVRRREVRVWSDQGVSVIFPKLSPGGEALGPWGWVLRREAWGWALDAGDHLWRLFSAEENSGKRFRLTAVEDPNRNRISLAYEDGRLVEVTDSVGRVLRVTSTPEGRIGQIRALNAVAQGRWVAFASFTYDERGDLVCVTDADGHAARYAYHDRHLLASHADRSGLTFHFAYDAKDRCVESWGDYPGRPDPSLADGVPKRLADGVTPARGVHHAKLEFHASGYVEAADSVQVRRFFGNAHGTVDKSVDGGRVTSRVYDDLGHVLSVKDPLGATTTYARDARGRALRVADPLGRVTTIDRDAAGNVTAVTDPAGGATLAHRDRFGNALTVTDPTGATTSYTYDARGEVTSIMSPNGARSTLEYDERANPIALVLPNGAAWRWTYDYLGRRLSETDPLGAVTRYSYTERGDLAAMHRPNGGVVRYEYDGEGKPTRVVDPNGQATEVVWGGYNRLCARRDANGGVVTLKYDREGEIVELWNERGEVHRFAYDAARRLVGETIFDGGVRSIRRDAVGRPTQITDALGDRTGFAWNLAGELVEKQLSGGDAERFEYNLRGEVVLAEGASGQIVFERDAVGRVVREVQRLGDEEHSVELEHDALGNPIARRTSLGHTETVVRDALGSRTRTVLDGAHAIEHASDPLGREVARRLAEGGAVESSFEPGGRLAQRRVTSPSGGRVVRPGEPDWLGARDAGVTVDTRYRYDLAQNLIDTWDATKGSAAYAYDPIRQLVSMTPSSARAVVFRYDAAGNVAEGGADRVYGPGNKLLRHGDTELTWDAEGRLVEKRARGSDGAELVWRYRWNDSGMLQALEAPDGTTVDFAYDPFARRLQKRVSKRVPGSSKPVPVETTRFVWDGDVLVHAIKRAAREGDDPVVEERTYVFEDGLTPQAHKDTRGTEADREPGPWYHYVNDAVGAPERLVTARGDVACELVRSVWGGMKAAPGATTDTPIRLAGQYEDEETGLAYNRARYYDAEIGRYISVDPLGLIGGVNGFAYGKNPTGYIDPLGRTVVNVAGGTNTIADTPGAFTLQVHGNPNGVALPGGYTQNPKDIANFIRSQPGYTPGTPIVLAACSTGHDSNGIAQQLSNEMGVPVTAPTQTLWTYPNGSHQVTSANLTVPGSTGTAGTMQTFTPSTWSRIKRFFGGG